MLDHHARVPRGWWGPRTAHTATLSLHAGAVSSTRFLCSFLSSLLAPRGRERFVLLPPLASRLGGGGAGCRPSATELRQGGLTAPLAARAETDAITADAACGDQRLRCYDRRDGADARRYAIGGAVDGGTGDRMSWVLQPAAPRAGTSCAWSCNRRRRKLRWGALRSRECCDRRQWKLEPAMVDAGTGSGGCYELATSNATEDVGCCDGETTTASSDSVRTRNEACYDR